MTPEEKINYALSLVEGATPGPWVAEDEYDPEDHAWIVLGGGAAGSINEFAVAAALGGYAAVSGAEWVKANAQQIALSPLIPAALRLALAGEELATWLRSRGGIYWCGEEFATAMRDEHGQQVYMECDSEVQCGDCQRITALYASLDAFLALLPEPPKEG